MENGIASLDLTWAGYFFHNGGMNAEALFFQKDGEQRKEKLLNFWHNYRAYRCPKCSTLTMATDVINPPYKI